MADFRIMKTEAEVEALAADWRALSARVGLGLFSDYSSYKTWWDCLGRAKGVRPFIATLWRQGRLVGVFPLVLYRKNGLRLLRVPGHLLFCGPTYLTETEDDFIEILRQLRHSRGYDFAEIKGIAPDSKAQQAILGFHGATLVEPIFVNSCRFDGRDGEAWFATLSAKMRSEFRRRLKRLEEKGPVHFAVYHNEAPREVIDEALSFKHAWCLGHGMQGPIYETNDFVLGLIEAALRRGELMIVCLSCGGQRIGYNICVGSCGVLYVYTVAGDPAWAAYAPSALANIQAIRWAADHGYDSYNFMDGREAYKIQYSNDEQITLTYVTWRTWRGWIGWLGLVIAKKLRERRGGKPG